MFVWDDTKRQKVLEDHGVDFALLTDAFDDPFGVYLENVEHSTENELRFNLIALAAQYCLVYITFTYDETDVRLITAWKAEKWAVQEYDGYRR